MAVAPPPTQRDLPPRPYAGVIREAKRRRLRRTVQVGIAVLVGLAALGGGIFALTRESPARHTLPHKRRGAPTDPAEKFGIRLSPSLDGGTYGWCVAVEEGSSIAGGGCGALPVVRQPIVQVLSDGTRKRYTMTILTTRAVASLLVNDKQRVATRELPGLPYGLRAAQIALPVHRVGRRGFVLPPEPNLLALAKNGASIPNPPFHPGPRVTPPRSGPCALTASGLGGLQREWSHVAAEIEPYTRALAAPAFFSCVDVEYRWQHWSLDAAILLNAANPASTPPAIPGLSPVTVRHGFFNGPGDFKGELTAIRHGNFWLVVAGGKSLAERIALLRHLAPTVHITR